MPAYSLAVWLLLQAVAAIPQAGPHFVQDCNPCTVTLDAAKTRSADFRFHLETTSDGRVVKSIAVERNGGVVQQLDVPSMTPLAADQPFFFGGQDINFDGWLDMVLMTEQGAANAQAQYWIYDPVSDRFKALGEFPVFRVNATSKRLSNYLSNGPAGLDFEKRDYAFQGQTLVLMREETQKPIAGRPGFYLHQMRQRRQGKLVVIHRESIRPRPAP